MRRRRLGGFLAVLPGEQPHRLWLPPSAQDNETLWAQVIQLGDLIVESPEEFTQDMQDLVRAIRTVEPDHVYETAKETE